MPNDYNTCFDWNRRRGCHPCLGGQPTIDAEVSAGSSAIDAGTLDVPNLPVKDFAPNPRVLDCNGAGEASPDMGAFEFVP